MPGRRIPLASSDAPRDLVRIRVDGEEVEAVRGEPVAMALWASGRVVLGRSVKYHRPRGAACFAGRCDGCLQRIDGEPSVRSCRTPAREGLVVETQNVVGSATLDLLAATDWFFPSGMDHHAMFTWARPVNEAMQLVARQVAGIGTLPDAPRSITPVERASTDVVVIGAGPAGLSVAAECASRGLAVWIVDEEAELGGWLRRGVRSAEGSAADDPALVAQLLARRVEATATVVRRQHAVIGIFDEGGERIVLVDGPAGLVRLSVRAVVVAQGRAEGAAAFVGSDLPAVIGSDAALRLLMHGIVPGAEVLIAAHPTRRGPELDGLVALLERHGAKVHGVVPLDDVDEARGRHRVSSVVVREGTARRSYRVDALIVAPPTGAVYELAVQAGARARLVGDGFELEPWSAEDAARTRLWLAGSVTGQLELEAVLEAAPRIADAIDRCLRSEAPAASEESR